MLCASSSTRSPPQGFTLRSFPLLPLSAYGMRIGREGLSVLRNSTACGPEPCAGTAGGQGGKRLPQGAVGTSGTALAGRIRKRHRHAGARASVASSDELMLRVAFLRRPHCCAAGKKPGAWPDEGGRILGCCPQRPLHIADEALEEPGGIPSGEEGPLRGGLARDLFLKELRARIGEKWGLLPDGDAAGFPPLVFRQADGASCFRNVAPLQKVKCEAPGAVGQRQAERQAV